MRASSVALVGLLAVAMSGCNGCSRNEKTANAAEAMAPLGVSMATLPLPVPGFGDAVVSIPSGATHAMPVLVAVLGIGDTPEEQCDTWRDIVGARAFVLCPRGEKHYLKDDEDAGAPLPVPTQAPAESAVVPAIEPSDDKAKAEPKPTSEPAPEEPVAPVAPKEAMPRALMQPKAASAEPRQLGFYPVDVPTLDREVTAGIAALKQKYGSYVADQDLVYAGFSRGAFLGASLVAKHPDRFGRAILIEGGQSAWTQETATQFARNGGKRVLFACGQASCLDESGSAATLLKAQRMDTKVVNGLGEGHGYKKQVKEQLKESFGWVVEGDPMWAAK